MTIVASAQQRMGIDTNTPDSSSLLEIQSTTAGLLIPRSALQGTNTATPITNPANSLLVYNTATASAGSTLVTPRYYYWEGSASPHKWVRLATAQDIVAASSQSIETVKSGDTNVINVTQGAQAVNKSYNRKSSRN